MHRESIVKGTCVRQANLHNKTSLVQISLSKPGDPTQLNPNQCRNVGVLSMTFSITKTYRQKTKEVVGLCKRRGGGGALGVFDSSTQILMSCWGLNRLIQFKNALSSDLLDENCRELMIEIKWMWGVQ